MQKELIKLKIAIKFRKLKLSLLRLHRKIWS